MNVDLDASDAPSWWTAAATFAGYLALLVVMTIVLFGIPAALFFALA
jgi:hypothetical protein